ncbi:FAD binding domain-containing protein [Streptomyces sp. SID13588]|uniref:FAD binding domain-containing protein n=1 Tax=Streptomyces sp. SID13588 TaxID=2706051 RepID=UPI001EF1DF79|nr:FAD binding domain-containing protein [Streptomyces sp. SID13588]
MAAPSATWRPGDAWLGGGTWLFSRPQPDIDRLLDLHHFGWPPCERVADGISIAATCTIGELLELPEVREWSALSLMRHCCEAFSGSFKIRNLATVGGNLALSLPIGPMISLFSGLDGVCVIESAARSRAVPASEFVTGIGTNVLEPDELVRSVLLPTSVLRDRVAFRRISLTRHGPSAVVVVGRSAPGGCTLTVTAATPCPRQLTFPDVPSAHEAIARLEHGAWSYVGDFHGSDLWRRHMTRKLVVDVLEELSG